MKPGFIKRDGMTLRQTKTGETLYSSIRIRDPEMIEYIADQVKETGLTSTQIIMAMLTKHFRTQVKTEK